MQPARVGVTHPQPFQFVPDRLIHAYAHDPLALGVWAMVALAAYRARCAVPLSAADLAELDDIPTAAHRVALMRRLQKLTRDGWLEANVQPGVRKHLLRPTWGRTQYGAVHPWDFTRTDHGRPSAQRARRLPTVLLDDGLGRITPQANSPLLIVRANGSTTSHLRLYDLGTYIRALHISTRATPRLQEVGLMQDGRAQPVPAVFPTRMLNHHEPDASTQATLTLIGIPATVQLDATGVWFTLHAPGDIEQVHPVLPTAYTVYVHAALWAARDWTAATVPVLAITGTPFLDRVLDPECPQIAVRATAIRSVTRSVLAEAEQSIKPALQCSVSVINPSCAPITCSDQESESMNESPPTLLCVGNQQPTRTVEEAVDDRPSCTQPERVTACYTSFSMGDSPVAECTSLDPEVQAGHAQLNKQRIIGRGEWYEVGLLQQQYGAGALLMWQERATRRQVTLERLFPSYYAACAAEEVRRARQYARAQQKYECRQAQVKTASPVPLRPLVSPTADVPTPAVNDTTPSVSGKLRPAVASRWRHHDPTCAQALTTLGIVCQGDLADVDPALILAWQPYAKHIGLQHEKRSVAGYVFTALLAGRAPDHTDLNTLAHKWGGSLDPSAAHWTNATLQQQAMQSLKHARAAASPTTALEHEYVH